MCARYNKNRTVYYPCNFPRVFRRIACAIRCVTFPSCRVASANRSEPKDDRKFQHRAAFSCIPNILCCSCPSWRIKISCTKGTPDSCITVRVCMTIMAFVVSPGVSPFLRPVLLIPRYRRTFITFSFIMWINHRTLASVKLFRDQFCTHCVRSINDIFIMHCFIFTLLIVIYN